MRNALTRRLAILHGDIEGVGFVEAFERALDASHGEEEVGDFGGREVGEARFDAEGRDEDVAREERFEVYESEGVGGCVEDLPFCFPFSCWWMTRGEMRDVLGM